jgi:DNA-binding NtrC family response regulator
MCSLDVLAAHRQPGHMPATWAILSAMDRPPLRLVIEDLNLEAAERRLCNAALEAGGNIVNAAELLGITRHALKRRIIKLGLERPRPGAPRRDP